MDPWSRDLHNNAHMIKAQHIYIGVAVLLVIGILYWFGMSQEEAPLPETVMEQGSTQDADVEDDTASLPNPASVHCTEVLGGTLEIRDTAEGQIGICHLPDGSMCEEWELYRTDTCVMPEGLEDAAPADKGAL